MTQYAHYVILNKRLIVRESSKSLSGYVAEALIAYGVLKSGVLFDADYAMKQVKSAENYFLLRK